jgi:hypothetical protein
MYLAYNMEQDYWLFPHIILAWICLRICRNLSLWYEVLYWRRFLCRLYNLFIYSFIHSFTHSFIHSFIHSLHTHWILTKHRAVQTQTERTKISASSMDQTDLWFSGTGWVPELLKTSTGTQRNFGGKKEERSISRHREGKIYGSFPFSSHLWFIVIIHNLDLVPHIS